MRCMFGKNMIKSVKRENCENSMKTIVTLIMLCGVLGGYAQTTPRYAATTKTWTVGTQTWSDAIHIPECNKSSFADSNTDTQCRSYTQDGNTWYYYNWPYVNKHAARLCPSPWRVPHRDDFCTLYKTLGSTSVCETKSLPAVHEAMVKSWCGVYGGHANHTAVVGHETGTAFWSASAIDSDDAYFLWVSREYKIAPQDRFSKHYGLQVRCVK